MVADDEDAARVNNTRDRFFCTGVVAVFIRAAVGEMDDGLPASRDACLITLEADRCILCDLVISKCYLPVCLVS